MQLQCGAGVGCKPIAAHNATERRSACVVIRRVEAAFERSAVSWSVAVSTAAGWI
jgi:hypothetical protein